MLRSAPVVEECDARGDAKSFISRAHIAFVYVHLFKIPVRQNKIPVQLQFFLHFLLQNLF